MSVEFWQNKLSACLSAHFYCILIVTRLHCINHKKFIYHGVQIHLNIKNTNILKLYPLGSYYIELRALAELFLENLHYRFSDMDMLAVHLQLSLMTNTTWKWLNWIVCLIALGLLCWFSWALTVVCSLRDH